MNNRSSGWGTLGHVPQQLEAISHQCRYVVKLLALIVSLSIANRVLNGLEIKQRNIAMYISTELQVSYAHHTQVCRK